MNSGKNFLMIEGISRYDVVNDFIIELKKAIEDMGHCVFSMKLSENPDECREICREALELCRGKKIDAVISFNGIGITLNVNGKMLSEYLNTKFYAILVDHPFYLWDRLVSMNKNIRVATVDYDHERFIKRYMSNVEETYMIPHGGIATGINRPYKERSIDVLFCGTYEAPEVYLKEINMCDGMIKTIALGVIDIMLKNCGMCIENAIYKFLEENLEENELTNIKSIMPDIMKDLAWVTDMYVRCFNRQLFIKKLLNLGICVHVYGKGWEDFKSEHSENLIVGGEINFEQSLKLMSDAKFVLNIMPGFKRGTHERVFCAMANGAVCATECTSYFSASFKENKEIIFFSLDNIEELADKLKYYLEHTDEAAQIAENGYKKVISEHMWKNRAVELLRTIE